VRSDDTSSPVEQRFIRRCRKVLADGFSLGASESAEIYRHLRINFRIGGGGGEVRREEAK